METETRNHKNDYKEILEINNERVEILKYSICEIKSMILAEEQVSVLKDQMKTGRR